MPQGIVSLIRDRHVMNVEYKMHTRVSSHAYFPVCNNKQYGSGVLTCTCGIQICRMCVSYAEGLQSTKNLEKFSVPLEPRICAYAFVLNVC